MRAILQAALHCSDAIRELEATFKVQTAPAKVKRGIVLQLLTEMEALNQRLDSQHLAKTQRQRSHQSGGKK